MTDSPPHLSLALIRAALQTDTDSEGSPTMSHSHLSQEPFPDSDETGTLPEESYQQAFEDVFTATMQHETLAQQVEVELAAPSTVVGEKKKLLDAMKELLSDPHLRVATRRRFIDLANKAMQLEHILFRRSEDFLGAQDTAAAQEIAHALFRYATWVENLLKDLLDTAPRVEYILGLVAEEETPVIVRYRRMACVVQNQLKKPRAAEQRLLHLYLDFFDEWVHAEFLRKRNEQIMQEELANMDRLKLTRYMHAIWDTLATVAEDYAVYREMLFVIKERFFVPIIDQRGNLPDLCAWLDDCAGA